MEKSIEHVWNNGFTDDSNILPPQINNLYNKKSEMLLDRLKRTLSLDTKSLIPMSILSLVISFYFEQYLLGVYLASVMLFLFALAKQKLKDLDKIKIYDTNFDYLVEYRNALHKIKQFYIKFTGFGLPLLGIIGCFLYLRNTAVYSDFLTLDFEIQILLVLGLTIFFSGFALAVYKLTTALVYGRFLKKLNELIEDINALQ